jgi:ribose 1,5-bisphosphokinase PhnN
MDPRGVLITGAYGTGKSSLIEEMASVLEPAGSAFAAIDLDWLMWFQADDAQYLDVYLDNLGAVVANYLQAGVRLFLLAGTVRDAVELERMREMLPFPVVVVRLTAPMSVIESRLSAAPTTGRADDLEVARRQVEEGAAGGIEDLALANEGSIQDAAQQLLDWLGWPPG